MCLGPATALLQPSAYPEHARPAGSWLLQYRHCKLSGPAQVTLTLNPFHKHTEALLHPFGASSCPPALRHFLDNWTRSHLLAAS
jgi:hypothetical protein